MASNHQKIHDDTHGALTVVALLKTCAKHKDLHGGRKWHCNVIRCGLLDMNVFVGSTLVSMYAKCGALEKAQEVLEELTNWNTVSWNALIAGYIQHGRSEEALHCFEQMQLGGISPNVVTVTCTLKACGGIGALQKGQEIHAQIAREPRKFTGVFNGLVDMYFKCGAIKKAQEVFDKFRDQDVVSWTMLIAGYVQQELGEEALEYFKKMQEGGFPPDAVTFTCVLKACSIIGASKRGQEIHAEIVRRGLLENDVHIGTALVDMYAKCGALGKAREVFDRLQACDIVLWNALIAGYVQHDCGEEALNCFERMQLVGFSPNAFTFACVLKACGSVGALDKGLEIHTQIMRERLLEKNIVVANALVDMYLKCGTFKKAQILFDELPEQNVVLWNVLITGYVQHGHSDKAFKCFERMQLLGFSPDAVTFVCLFKACSCVGAVYNGQMIHTEIIKHGYLEEGTVVGTALVDMYANCGMLGEAQYLFDNSPVQDVVLWSVLVVGYAQVGNDESVFSLLNKMVGEGTQPDMITFTIVLNTCARRGLLSKGQTYFEIISKGYGIIPAVEHQTCMVTLFGRAGHLDKAVAVMKEMPGVNFELWHSMLGACQRLGNMNLGGLAFEHVVHSDEKVAANFSI